MKEKLTNFNYKAAKVFNSHQAFIVLVAVLVLLVGVFVRINSLGNLPIDQHYLDQETGKVKIIQFNEKSIEQIKALNDSNVVVPTNLPDGRQNPFNE